MFLHLDLFSGIGGFALAAQRCGFTTIAFSEIEPYACKILKQWWPDVPNLGDIRNVTAQIVADAAQGRIRRREAQRQGGQPSFGGETLADAASRRARPAKQPRQRNGFEQGGEDVADAEKFTKRATADQANAVATGGQARHESRDDGKSSIFHLPSSITLITGGFPCQPFSFAGQRRGAADDRHLWPEMRRVIMEVRPDFVVAENVPGIIGMELDGVLSDLEAIGYTCGTLVIPACAVDARHRRNRVWILAHSKRAEWRPCNERGGRLGQGQNGERQTASGIAGRGEVLANADKTGRREQCRPGANGKKNAAVESGGCGWFEWPVEPELGRVADGIPHRAHRLKGLGNAIVPQVAEMILRNVMKIIK